MDEVADGRAWLRHIAFQLDHEDADVARSVLRSIAGLEAEIARLRRPRAARRISEHVSPPVDPYAFDVVICETTDGKPR